MNESTTMFKINEILANIFQIGGKEKKHQIQYEMSDLTQKIKPKMFDEQEESRMNTEAFE